MQEKLTFSAAPPLLARGQQEVQGAVDVGIHEGSRPQYGTIDVPLRGKMHNLIDAVAGEQVLDRVGVANVPVDENHLFAIDQLLDIGQISRIGQRVNDNQTEMRLYGKQAQEIAADESGASGNQ